MNGRTHRAAALAGAAVISAGAGAGAAFFSSDWARAMAVPQIRPMSFSLSTLQTPAQLYQLLVPALWLILGGLAALLAANLADCDQCHGKRSSGMEILYHMLCRLLVFCLLLQWGGKHPVDWQFAVFFVFAIFVGSRTEHRSATHSLVALLLYSWLFYRMTGQNQRTTAWFFAGYASHLVLDFLNKKGEALLWPLLSKRFCMHLSRSESRLGDGIYRVSRIVAFLAMAWILLQSYRIL